MMMTPSPLSSASATMIWHADDLPELVLPHTSRCGVVRVSQYTGLARSSTPMGNICGLQVNARSQFASTLVRDGELEARHHVVGGPVGVRDAPVRVGGCGEELADVRLRPVDADTAGHRELDTEHVRGC